MRHPEKTVILLGAVIWFTSCQISEPSIVISPTDTETLATKSGEISYSIENTTLNLTDNGTYSAIISFNRGEYYSYSGFENMEMAYCPDFFLHDPVNKRLKYLLEDDTWMVEYYPSYNTLRLSPCSQTGNIPIYILGNGHCSGLRWISDIHGSSDTFYNFQSPYYTLAPQIAENTYQTTIRLFTGNAWGDVRLEFYSDNAWTKSYKLNSASTVVFNNHGASSGIFEICDSGTETCNLHSTSAFTGIVDGGLYRVLIYKNTAHGCLDLSFDLINDSSELAGIDNYIHSLEGKLVYHNYTSYGDGSSNVYTYDFKQDRLSTISTGWTEIQDPMNAKFNQNGSKITFMGIDKIQDSWDVYISDATGSTPYNLTPKNTSGDYRDEDPIFAPNGSSIYFKRGGKIARYSLNTGNIELLSSNNEEFSMLGISPSEDKVIGSIGSGASSKIAYWDLLNNSLVTVYGIGVQEYYPVVIDSSCFYYTSHWSVSNRTDRIMKGYWDASEPTCLPFNSETADYSDACPISDGWIILSSTKGCGKGGYDLFLVNENYCFAYPLSIFNNGINTSLNELGANYIL